MCNLNISYISLGYGFVDFEHPQSAQTAVAALTAKGIQAQMAKVHKIFICVFKNKSFKNFVVNIN